MLFFLSSVVSLFVLFLFSPSAWHCAGESPAFPESRLAPLLHNSSNEGRFEFRGEFDPGRGGAYSLALNPDATRLYVIGESSWLDILDIAAPSDIQSLANQQFQGMPHGPDGEYGIAYDPHFERVAVGGGPGGKVHLIDIRDDQLHLLDAAYPPDLQFHDLDFPKLITTPPVFIKQGSAIAAAMKTGGFADDPSAGQKVYFGEGVYLLSIDPITQRMSIVDEGIGGFPLIFGGLSTICGQLYDPARDLLWCGGREGAEALVDFSHRSISQYRYWSHSSSEEGPRVMPDLLTRDGRWLIERIASRFPANDWSICIRQIQAADGTYSLWNADMPSDGTSPQLLGSPPANWNSTPGRSSANPSKPLLPCVLTHDQTHVITAETGGSELLILDITDKTARPQLLPTESIGEGEQIQSIKGHRNRFYISLKSGRILVYEWNYVQQPAPPSTLEAVPSSSDQSITLSWTPPPAGVPPAGYNIYRKTASTPLDKVATVNETTRTDECTAEETTYIYTVRSFAPQYAPIESDDSPQAQTTTPSGIPPKKVLGLSAQPTLGAIALSWKPNPEADVIGYLVYRKTGDTLFVKITPSPLTESQYLDINLDTGSDSAYYLTAMDANLEGPASDTVTLAPADRTPNLLLNPAAEEQSLRHWSNASTTIAPDPTNRHCFNNDLFIAVTNGWSAEAQWAFWADQTSGRYDRQTFSTMDQTYLLAAYQDVDVSPFSAAIDSPEKRIVADWGGQVIRTNMDQSALPSIAIEFLDASQSILDRHELSSETTGEWVSLSSSGPVLIGTASIRFWMFAPEVTASPANAAWDDLWLILREEQPPEPPLVAVGRNVSGVTVSFGPTATDMTYQIGYTDELLSTATHWKPCGPTFSGDGGTIEWLDSPDEQLNPTNPPATTVKYRFYRVSQQ